MTATSHFHYFTVAFLPEMVVTFSCKKQFKNVCNMRNKQSVRNDLFALVSWLAFVDRVLRASILFSLLGGWLLLGRTSTLGDMMWFAIMSLRTSGVSFAYSTRSTSLCRTLKIFLVNANKEMDMWSYLAENGSNQWKHKNACKENFHVCLIFV